MRHSKSSKIRRLRSHAVDKGLRVTIPSQESNVDTQFTEYGHRFGIVAPFPIRQETQQNACVL
jgi:hypothetical protein